MTTTRAFALVMLGAITAAWFVPVLAIPLVWPWLFAIPGILIVRRVAPDLPRPGIAGAGIVTSTYLSAHLVNLVSRSVGFDRLSILIAVAGLVILMGIVVRLDHPWLAPVTWPRSDEIPQRIARIIRADRAAWSISAIVGLVVLAVLGSNAWNVIETGVISGGWNWSDFLVHVAIGNSIVHGNFPPEVPYVAGEPLTYHWFADFHGAISASVAGVGIIGVFIVSSAVMAGALALVVWSLTRVLTGDRRVAAIATVLVCAGGGLGWIRLVGDLLAGGELVDLVTNNAYDNTWSDDWPFFRIASVFGTGFLPHRATTFGLPGLVTVVLLVVSCLGRRPAGILLAGLLAALLAPFHFYAFPATYLIVGLFVLTSGAWRTRTVWRDAALFLAPAVLALPFILPAVANQRDLGSFRFVLGWGEARFDDGPGAALFFYVTNLGIPVLLAVIALAAPRLAGGRPLPHRAFLGAWLVALFLVPNLVVVSSVEFDMNKYFQMMWIAAAVLAAWLIARWPRPVIAAVVLIAALSPTLIAIWHVRSPAVALSRPQEAAGRWIEANTPPRSVFVTDAFINSPVDLAGRLRVTSFGPYVANLGIDPEPRAAAVRAVYCDGPEVAVARMAEYGATYVLSSGGLLECDGHEPTDFRSTPLFETVYDADGVAIWRLVPG